MNYVGLVHSSSSRESQAGVSGRGCGTVGSTVRGTGGPKRLRFWRYVASGASRLDHHLHRVYRSPVSSTGRGGLTGGNDRAQRGPWGTFGKSSPLSDSSSAYSFESSSSSDGGGRLTLGARGEPSGGSMSRRICFGKSACMNNHARTRAYRGECRHQRHHTMCTSVWEEGPGYLSPFRRGLPRPGSRH